MNEWELAQQICDMPEVDEVIRGFVEDQTGDNATMIVREVIRALKEQPQNSDDIAVDRFAAAMKNKLAKKREEGRSGWETASPEFLTQLMRVHMTKGDPVDVANFCMMLFCNGSSIQHEDKESFQLPENEVVLNILARPNFACGGIANRLRKLGHSIPTNAENEQAHVLFWMLNLYLKHGENWAKVGDEYLTTPPAPVGE